MKRYDQPSGPDLSPALALPSGLPAFQKKAKPIPDARIDLKSLFLKQLQSIRGAAQRCSACDGR